MGRDAVATVILGLILCNSLPLQAAPEPHYLRKTPNSRGVIVFVHGLSGDGTTSWTNSGSHAYWPDLLTKDPTFNDFDIYVYEYASRPFANTYSIDELTDDMRAFLDDGKVTKHRDVVFLAHSLGGIVVRGYLTKYQQVAENVKFAYFLATPTTGSGLARLGSLISRNPQIDELRPMKSEGYLANLQRQWLAAEFKFPSYCAYEKQTTSIGLVVDQASATNLCTKPLDAIDADHIGIAKPESTRSKQYITFRNAFVEIINPGRAPSIASVAGTAPDRTSKSTGTPKKSMTSEPLTEKEDPRIQFKASLLWTAERKALVKHEIFTNLMSISLK